MRRARKREGGCFTPVAASHFIGPLVLGRFHPAKSSEHAGQAAFAVHLVFQFFKENADFHRLMLPFRDGFLDAAARLADTPA